MNTEDSRKRPPTSEYASSVKRLCQGSATSNSSNDGRLSNDSPSSPVHHPYIASLFSIKDMLTVPLEYIFRQCPSSHHTSQTSPSQTRASNSGRQHRHQQPRSKPLLSRSEASCLIRIQTLAAEIDSLVQFSAHVLMEQVEWMTFHDDIVRSGIVPLRALLPLLLTLGQTFAHGRLRSLQADLTEALKELEILADSLRQSSEANWTTSEALLEVGATNAVAVEKRRLCDLQDELAQRIDHLVQTTIIDETEDDDSEDQGDIWNMESSQTMEDYCRQVWGKKNLAGLVLSPSQPSSSQNSRLSVDPAGKENEPSQHSTNSAVVEVSQALCPGSASQNAALALSTLAFTSGTPNTGGFLSNPDS